MRFLLKGLSTIIMAMAIIGNSSTSFFFTYQPKKTSTQDENFQKIVSERE